VVLLKGVQGEDQRDRDRMHVTLCFHQAVRPDVATRRAACLGTHLDP